MIAFYGVGIDDRIDQAGGGLQTLWRAVASLFLIILLVAAGVTIERAVSRKTRLADQLSPSGFGQVQKSTYAISESSGLVRRPRAMLDTSDWKVVQLPSIGVELQVPSRWRQEDGVSSVTFTISSSLFGSKTFVISRLMNPSGLSPDEFVWYEMLESQEALSQGVIQGTVELAGSWFIDGVQGDSILVRVENKEGEYIVLPRGSQTIVFFAQDARFSAENKELLTVLSTVKMSP